MYRRAWTKYLYSLVDECEWEALDAWRNEHQPGMSVCDALALRAHNVTTEIKRQQGGNISVTVSIDRRGRRRTDRSFFHLQTHGKHGYIRRP